MTENTAPNPIQIIRKMIEMGATDEQILQNLKELGVDSKTAMQLLAAGRREEKGYIRTVLTKPEIVIDSYKSMVEGVEVEVDIIQRPGDFVLEYFLNFPEYGSGTKALLVNLKNSIISDSTIRTEKMLDPKFIFSLKQKFREKASHLLDQELPNVDPETKKILTVVILQEMLGLGKIEFLLADSNLEEIVINSAQEPVWVYNKKFGWLKTNLFIQPEEEIQNFASIIARRVGKQITVLSPLLDAHLITGDRANATLFPISSRGNTITIRRFRRDPWTAVDFIKNKTVNSEIMALIWLAMQYEMNIIVSGGTASGKTSILNVMLPFIQPNQRIISIEDTRELLLPDFLHWVPMTTREATAEGKGEVCLYPDNWFLLGNGELRQIGEYAKTCLNERPTTQLESNVLGCDGKGDAVVAGDPEKFSYGTEPIAMVSKVTDRKQICKIDCENGETITLTENTKLPVIGESGKIELLVPGEIQKGSFYLPVFKHVRLDLPLQTINALDILREKRFFAVNANPILLPLLKEAKENGKTRKAIMGHFGHGRQCIQWYLKRNIVPLSLLAYLSDQSRFLPKTELENRITRIKASGGAAHAVTIPRIVDEDLAYLAGFLLAEKHVAPNGIFVSQKEVLPHIERIIKEKFGIGTYQSVLTTQYGKYNNYGIMSQVVRHFLVKAFGLGKSKQVRVPRIIMRSPDVVVASFLAGFIDGDGSVGKGRITMAAPTLEAAVEFKYLFSRLGIWSKIAKGKKVFILNVCRRKSLKKAAETLPFQREKNKMDAKRIQETPFGHACKEDLIPALLLRKHLQHLQSLSTEEKRHHYYHTLFNQTAMPKQYLQEQLLATGLTQKDIDAVALLLREDLEFVKITTVAIQPNTENIPTYDVTPSKSTYFMAGTHNLTLVMDTMLDLLVNSLRMRPDRIIVGEVRRQREAEVMFEGMHTGHSVYTTFHANTAEETIRRMTNPPLNIPPSMLDSVHLNLVMFRNRRLGVRRVLQIAEFIPEKRGSEEVLRPNVLYRWRPSTDEIVRNAESIRFEDELSLHTGMNQQAIREEIKTKQRILEWMVSNNLHNINQVGRAMAEYYMDEEKVLNWVQKGTVPEFLKKENLPSTGEE